MRCNAQNYSNKPHQIKYEMLEQWVSKHVDTVNLFCSSLLSTPKLNRTSSF